MRALALVGLLALAACAAAPASPGCHRPTAAERAAWSAQRYDETRGRLVEVCPHWTGAREWGEWVTHRSEK